MKGKHWPPYSTALRNGNRRLQYPDPAQPGRKISIRSILPGEPADGYSSPAEAWAAYARLEHALTERRDYGVTVRGFWERWTDEYRSPWRKGVIDGGRRNATTLRTLRSQSARFVAMHGDVPMAAITRRDHVQRYLDSDPSRTSLTALALMWRDAATDKGGQIVTTNPFTDLAQQVAREDSERREDSGIMAPLDWQIDGLLARAYSDPYPIGFAAWLEFGGETGLRAGELDAVRFDRKVELEDGSIGLLVDQQFHADQKTFEPPKYKSVRTIALTARAVEIIDFMRPIAAKLGSPFVFNTKSGKHLSDGYRDRYWTGDKTIVGLRTLVDGLQMKNVTRHYFATTALREYNRQMLAGEGTIPFALLAEHMGHKDGGETLRKHYAKTYAQDMQRGMGQFFANRSKHADQLAQQRRRAQIGLVDSAGKNAEPS